MFAMVFGRIGQMEVRGWISGRGGCRWACGSRRVCCKRGIDLFKLKILPKGRNGQPCLRLLMSRLGNHLNAKQKNNMVSLRCQVWIFISECSFINLARVHVQI